MVGGTPCLEVLHDVGHLNIQLALDGIVGQHAGEKQLLVIGVGGEQQQIGLLTGRVPDLHPVGQVAGGKGVNVGDNGSGREGQGQGIRCGIKQVVHIHKFVEKGALAAGDRSAGGVSQGPRLRNAVKFDVKGRDSVCAGQRDRCALGNGCICTSAPVKQALGIGDSLGFGGGVGMGHLSRQRGHRKQAQEKKSCNENSQKGSEHRASLAWESRQPAIYPD